MNLEDIRDGATVLVDANILLYARRGSSTRCREFLVRCDRKAVSGVITTVILAEFCHRQMVIEAQATGVAASSPVRTLGRNPAKVRQLGSYAADVRNLLGGGLHIEAVGPADFPVALEIQKQHGLLTNDALNLAVARRLEIHEIATADSDFDDIQGCIAYQPDDLPPAPPAP